MASIVDHTIEVSDRELSIIRWALDLADMQTVMRPSPFDRVEILKLEKELK